MPHRARNGLQTAAPPGPPIFGPQISQTPTPLLTASLSNHLQIELDFKAECTAGNAIEAHCNPLDDHSASFVGPAPANGNGNGHAAEPAADSAPLYFLSMLQKCDENGCTELVRARTTWSRTLEGAKPAPPPLSELSAAQ